MTMTDVVVINPSEMRELTIDELEEAGGGLYPPVVGADVSHVADFLLE